MVNNEDDAETYILLLLSDSNLPTGSFVASTGLESYMKHGFPAPPTSTVAQATIDFVRDNLASYARTAIPFVSDAHRAVESLALQDEMNEELEVGKTNVLGILRELDDLYQSMTLNHVARRASTAQGVALLTLYSKGFSRPTSISDFPCTRPTHCEKQMAKLFDEFKMNIRKEEVAGHLPVCWGILTAALGLKLGMHTQNPLHNKKFIFQVERSQFLHLFLHCRSLLSASVRLNDIGPYGAQQIILHAVRPLVAAETARCRDLRTGILDGSFNETTMGPANTWPLGEILAGRHDLQHSRIFNS